MVCTMLMAGGLKDRETFQLTFSGSGPLGGVVAISDGEGGVRGYVTNGKVRCVRYFCGCVVATSVEEREGGVLLSFRYMIHEKPFRSL